LAALLTLQVVTGVSNVVLGWPLLAAVLHTGGAGAVLALLVWMLAMTQQNPVAAIAPDYSRRLTP
jgi:cytochrome c oxidase assembly protein subunit 15